MGARRFRGAPRRVRTWLDRRSARLVQALYDEVSGAEIHRPGWDLARVASYLLALCVHACTLALLVLAGLLVWSDPKVVTVIIAALLVAIALFAAPRLGRLPKHAKVRFRADAPALFGLLDRIGADMGCRPVHAVMVTGEYNASYGRVGLRRPPVLRIGLPLWDALTSQQRVALLGHELAHGVNGDSRHGLVVGTSLAALARLHHTIRPGGRDLGVNYILDLLTRLIQGAFSSVIALIFRIQQLTALRAGQRAEYLADDLAARVASPAAAAGMLDTMLTAETSHIAAVRRHSLGAGRPEFWDERRAALARLPETEWERRRRIAARQRLRVDESHPPTHLRIAMLRRRQDAEPRIRLDAGEEAKIQAELTPDYARVAKELREQARAALYR